jgi:Cu(I)/Ag(I) efflux system membrane fusion protein
MKNLLIAVFCTSLLLTACNNSSNDTQNNKETVAQPDTTNNTREKVADNTHKALDNVYNEYINIKDALYDNDANKVKSATTDMKKALDDYKTDDMPAADIEGWNKMAKHIREHLDQMETSKDIKAQRNVFADLSGAMIEAVKTMGLKDKSAYVQHCPMYKTDKGEGADWLSQREKVENPYFGSKSDMTSCGEIKETLKY